MWGFASDGKDLKACFEMVPSVIYMGRAEVLLFECYRSKQKRFQDARSA